MEQVFPLNPGKSFSANDFDGRKNISGSGAVFQNAVVIKVVGPGNFIVLLESGARIAVRGARGLKEGSPVKILIPPVVLGGTAPVSEAGLLSPDGMEGLQWFVLIPLGFGGREASARLEVFVERRKEGGKTAKEAPPAYFVFTVQTEECGEVQWSIHLRGRQVALHVYAKSMEKKRDALKKMILEVEASLRSKGFAVAAPALWLKSPFKVPAGFRLNVKG